MDVGKSSSLSIRFQNCLLALIMKNMQIISSVCRHDDTVHDNFNRII